MVNLPRYIISRLVARINHQWQLHILQNPHLKELHRYQLERGMVRFVESFPLSQNSVVFDVGGYTGEWAMRIWHKYECTIEIFEPVPQYLTELNSRFRNVSRVKVNPYGLGNKSRCIRLSAIGDATSEFRTGSEDSSDCQIRSISEVLKEKRYDALDLMAINIEGGEYELIDEIIRSEAHRKIRNILIQFHSSIPEYRSRRAKIQNLLSETHVQTFCYDMVWENWRLKC
jgi:FkbM family methyltransferase